MYEINGFVCAGNPDESIKVMSAKALDDMIMIITFSNGETRLFDATILDGPVFESLKENEVFKVFEIGFGVVTWKNGDIDCAPKYMYKHSYEYTKIA